MPRGTSLRDEAWLQRRLWSASEYRPDIWLDASDLSALVSAGSTASQLTDKSGNGRHATQATGANQPTISTLNGVQALSTDGTNDMMAGTYAVTLTGAEVWLVGQLANNTGATTNYGRLFNLCDAGNDYAAGGYIPCIRSLTSGNVGSFSGSIQATLSTTPPEAFIFNSSWSGSTLRNSKNAGTPSTASISLSKSITRFAICGSLQSIAPTDGWWPGIFGEAIFWSAALVGAYKGTCISGYLAHKWRMTDKLPATHPNKSRPPLIGVL
jgi:hypothetical protein